MNTSKQINIMVALLFIAAITAGAYTMWDPSRASSARDEQLKQTLDRAAFTFAQNCRVCHGDSGEGGLKSNRLAAAPALNRPDLQGRTTAGGPVDIVARTQAFQRVYYTITCGRIGTPMPTWGETQGGTLNDEQILQLATLITDGTGWGQADQYSLYGYPPAHIAGEASDGLALARDLSATDTTVYLNKVSSEGAPVVSKGDRLQIVATGQAPSDTDEIMTVTDINAAQNSVTVTRPVGTTKAVAHKAGDQVTRPAVPPNPPAITGKDTPPSCGQNPPAAAAAPSPSPTPGGPTPTAQAVSATLTISAQNTLFDKSSLAAPAGQKLTLTFDNKDNGIPHDIQFFKGTDATGPSVGTTAIEAGPVTQTLTFGPLDAGTYYYHCDVHPTTMFGTLTVQ
ncbi:MAG TPA: cupredoxin domain-containing protein [Dehalococcoidia bacterium]|nr:cupredoxin domain-containing protein [Dehalococcoidia bacterium]